MITRVIQSPARHRLWPILLVSTLSLTGSVSAQTGGLLYAYDPNGTLLAVAASNSAPVVLAPPQPGLLQPGNSFGLSVVASGPGPLFYQWQLNGTNISGATNDSFFLANPSTNYLGNYQVVISNSSGSITSAVAPVALDSNGNGIPDWWEMKYFGNLNQAALGDYDHDGVDNLDEYLEGTNPTNSASFNPRLYIQAAHGSVSVSPKQPHYTMGQLVTLTAIPDPGQGFVGWSGYVTGTKTSTSFLINTNAYITANFGYPLGTALDNTNLVWTTTGNELWFGQAQVSHDGVNAAQSGPIVSYWDGANFVGDQTTLQTTFYLPQTQQLGFWWAVSSQPPDGISFTINSNLVAQLSGESLAWQYFQTNLVAGVYTLAWTFSKGPVDIPDGMLYSDAAWVDQVTLTSLAPVLGIQLTGAKTMLLNWPLSSIVYRLQQTATLSPANWTDTTNAVTVSNGINQVFITPAGTTQFYRLVHP